MELHSSKFSSLVLLCGVCCIWTTCIQVRADAMVPQNCSTQTSQPCQALIGYIPMDNFNLLEIASLFSLNYTALLGPNDIDPSLPNLSQFVLPAATPSSIPQTCGCVNDQRVVTSANYTVVSGNTLSLISDTLYSSLVTYQEIAAANGITNPNLIEIGQVFTIPIPCACFNVSNGTQPSIALSYQIQSGDSLSAIAAAYNTSAAVLQQLNSLPSASITPSSVLFVPLSECKANFSSGALDEDLTAVEGKYELTANGCVRCNCANGTLHCIQAPSSLGSSCANITCPSSNLTLGSSTASQGNGQCTIRSCVYKGYNNSGIMAVLETEEDSSCPVALPPETFYKPPSGIVAAPLPTLPAETVSSPPPSTPAATPPTSTTPTSPSSTSNSSSNSASMLLVGISFSSCWWTLLLASLLL